MVEYPISWWLLQGQFRFKGKGKKRICALRNVVCQLDLSAAKPCGVRAVAGATGLSPLALASALLGVAAPEKFDDR